MHFITMTPLQLLVSVMLLFLTSSDFVVANDQLKAALAAKETGIKNLAAAAETAVLQRCQGLATCINDDRMCSVPACGGASAFESFQCNYNFGNDTGTCGCDGLLRSTQDTVVRVPFTYDSQSVAEFACLSKSLESEFKVLSGTLDAWQYMGHESGGTRIYPGAPQGRSDGSCGDYDPRLRPWYVAAAGGPKDVIVIFERSRYMDTTWKSTRCAMHKLLDSFTQNDFVSLIGYHGQVKDLGAAVAGGGMLRATENNIRYLKEQLNDIVAEGDGYDDVRAYELAFNLFSKSTSSSGCPKIIIHLTEGLTQSLKTNAAISRGQQLLSGKKAHIFGMSIFAQSKGRLDHHLQSVTCENAGVWTQVHGDPLEKMKPYFQFLSLGLSTSRSVWTNLYIDAFGMGEMVTVAAPIFDRNFNPPLIVGVAGTDVLLTELNKVANSSDILSELQERGKDCPSFNVDNCTLQLIREQTGFVCPAPYEPIETCRAQKEVFTKKCSTSATIESLLCQGFDGSGDATVSCCGSKSNGQCLKNDNPIVKSPPAIPNGCPSLVKSAAATPLDSSSITFVMLMLLLLVVA